MDSQLEIRRCIGGCFGCGGGSGSGERDGSGGGRSGRVKDAREQFPLHFPGDLEAAVRDVTVEHVDVDRGRKLGC